MINAQDLRIGNWVILNDDTDRNGQVLELSEYSAKLKCNYIPDHQENEVVSTTIDYEFISPIELTPELLEKCGFVVSEDLGDMVYYQFPNQNHGYGICRNHDEWEFYRYHGIGMEVLIYDEKHFQYLHQLQNLFYSLTGKELEITL